jgi:hypothetical protein
LFFNAPFKNLVRFQPNFANNLAYSLEYDVGCLSDVLTFSTRISSKTVVSHQQVALRLNPDRLDDLEKIHQRTGETIILGHDDHIIGAQMLDLFVELGPVFR